MTSTTSLKLTDELKAQIAEVAARAGVTAHALMVDTLQQAMDDARMRQAFYDEAEVSYRETLRTNRVYRHEDVKKYILGTVRGKKVARPKAVPYDPSKPMLPQ